MLYYLTNSIALAQISDFKGINFQHADKVAELNKGANLHNLPGLVFNLTHNLNTDVEKFRAIHTWVCNNIKGDNKQHNLVSRKLKKFKNDSLSFLKWNSNYKAIAFKTLLKHKKTMCTGYAYLIKEMCFLANIESVIINGYSRSSESNVKALEQVNHSWNAVKLDQKWYLCDATWSSGYINEYGLFVKEYNDGYFLADPKRFGQNHFPSNPKWKLNTSITNQSFISAPLVYCDAFKYDLSPVLPKLMEVSIPKKTDLSFKIKTPISLKENNLALVYYVGNREINLDIYNIKQLNDSISFDYNFKSKGTFDVHLKVNNSIVTTYTINVMSKPKMSYITETIK